MDTSVPLVTPSAAYPAPTKDDLDQLERVGHAFEIDGDRETLPLDPGKVSARDLRPGFANAVGAVLSLVVLLVEAGTKFTEGAWLVVVLVPLIMGVALLIRRHYRDVRRATAPSNFEVPWKVPSNPAHESAGLVVVPIEHLDGSALRALAYAVELVQPVLAIHLVPDQSAEEHFLEAWKALGEPVRLEIVRSPYRAIVAPLGQYLLALHAEKPDPVLTVVLPEIVPRNPLARPLHGRVTKRLRHLLEREQNIVLTSVPFAV
jgi:hypothetical protein